MDVVLLHVALVVPDLVETVMVHLIVFRPVVLHKVVIVRVPTIVELYVIASDVMKDVLGWPLTIYFCI